MANHEVDQFLLEDDESENNDVPNEGVLLITNIRGEPRCECKAWQLMILALFTWGIFAGVGILVGRYGIKVESLPQECPIRCEKLTVPMHVNRTTSHCHDESSGKISLVPLENLYGLCSDADCFLSCETGFALNGSNKFHCSKNGSWIPRIGSCQKNSCVNLEALTKGTTTCSHQNLIGSVCEFQCGPGTQLVGFSETTCLSNLNWSPPTPRCSCPNCTVGSLCQYSIDWLKVSLAVPKTPWGKSTVNYGGMDINCVLNKHKGMFSTKWDCECLDALTHQGKKCHKFQHEEEACRHSLANVISTLAAAGKYPKPCHADEMHTELGCT